MKNGFRFLFGLCGITIINIFLPAAGGHFGILLPEEASVRKGEGVGLRYFSGHPFECQIVDTQPPERVQAVSPGGQTRVGLKTEPKQVDNGEGGKVTVQTMTFNPSERGDHWVVVTSPPRFDEHAGGFVQDELKVLVRVQVTHGWENAVGQTLELVPLSRPYGLKPGHVFKVQARLDGKPLADAMVEIEKFNAKPPERLPEDEALITQVVRSDVNGYVTCTLDEAGWWGLMVTAQVGTREKDGKSWPVVRRGILWVHVEEATK